MGINKTKLKVLETLFSAGFNTEKKILTMGIEDILNMDKLSRTDMIEISRMKSAIKSRKFIEYLSGADEDTQKEGEHGGE